MTTIVDESDRPETSVDTRKVKMTEAMREGLDALQREYDAFVESSYQTLALISNRRGDR